MEIRFKRPLHGSETPFEHFYNNFLYRIIIEHRSQNHTIQGTQHTSLKSLLTTSAY